MIILMYILPSSNLSNTYFKSITPACLLQGTHWICTNHTMGCFSWLFFPVLVVVSGSLDQCSLGCWLFVCLLQKCGLLGWGSWLPVFSGCCAGVDKVQMDKVGCWFKAHLPPILLPMLDVYTPDFWILCTRIWKDWVLMYKLFWPWFYHFCHCLCARNDLTRSMRILYKQYWVLFTCVISLPIFRCWLIPEWYESPQQQHCDKHRYWNWCCSSGLHYYIYTLL